MSERKCFMEKRREGTWGFCCLCYLWLMKMSHASLGLLIEFTSRVTLLTTNEQRPRVHECALSSLFNFAQQCFLASFLDIPVLIIIVMEFGIGPPLYGTWDLWNSEPHGRLHPFVKPVTSIIVMSIDEWNSLAFDNYSAHLWTLWPAWPWTYSTNEMHYSRIIPTVEFWGRFPCAKKFPVIRRRYSIVHWTTCGNTRPEEYHGEPLYSLCFPNMNIRSFIMNYNSPLIETGPAVVGFWPWDGWHGPPIGRAVIYGSMGRPFHPWIPFIYRLRATDEDFRSLSHCSGNARFFGGQNVQVHQVHTHI